MKHTPMDLDALADRTSTEARSLNRWITITVTAIVFMAATYSAIHFVVLPRVDAAEDEWRDRSRLAGRLVSGARNISERLENYQQQPDTVSLRRVKDAVRVTQRRIDSLSIVFAGSRELSDSVKRLDAMLQTWQQAAGGRPSDNTPGTLSITPEAPTPKAAAAYATLLTSADRLDAAVEVQQDGLHWWEDAFYYISLAVLILGLLAILLILLRLRAALLRRFRESAAQRSRLESQACELAAANGRLTLAAQNAELSLREHEVSEAFLKSAIDSCDIGFGFLDTDLRFTLVNRFMADVNGVNADGHVGRTPRELSPAISARSEPIIRRVLQSGNSADGVTFRANLASQPEIAREFAASHFPIRTDSGELIGCGIAVTDLTEQKALQEQLWQSQKMEAVGQLAGGIAHDFNNLLTVISGHVEMLLLAEQTESNVADLRQVKRASDQAAALTSKLLSYSRKQVMTPQSVNLDSVLSEIEPMLRRLLPADINLKFARVAGDETVTVDPVYIEQAVMNLVVNARDAMPQGGTITIETTSASDPAYEHLAKQLGDSGRSFTILSVRDSGQGMSEFVKSKAFQPFFTTKAIGKGTGLGLATVYGIVKQSAGHVVIESEEGMGTNVIILLPQTEALDAETAEPVVRMPRAKHNETILLVDDNEDLLRMTTRMLEGLSYTVLTASNGREALRVLTSRHVEVDLVLCDVVMPELSGPALVKHLDDDGHKVRSVLMSGHPRDEMSQRGLEMGNVVFLRKPFSLESLANVIRLALDHEKQSAA